MRCRGQHDGPLRGALAGMAIILALTGCVALAETPDPTGMQSLRAMDELEKRLQAALKDNERLQALLEKANRKPDRQQAESMQRQLLELAADYLVMAAWRAYLKSALLLPKEEQEDPSPEELALKLQLRLQRLGAMREAAARLMARDRLGRDVFARGAPEGLRLVRKSAWRASAFDLYAAYGVVKARSQPPMHVIHARSVMTLDEAIDRVARMIGMAIEWTAIEAFLPATDDPRLRRSALASSFLAALELARRGSLDIDQEEAFAPIRLRVAA